MMMPMKDQKKNKNFEERWKGKLWRRCGADNRQSVSRRARGTPRGQLAAPRPRADRRRRRLPLLAAAAAHVAARCCSGRANGAAKIQLHAEHLSDVPTRRTYILARHRPPGSPGAGPRRR